MSEENKRAIPFEKPDDSLEDLLANPFGEQDRAEETRGEQPPKRMIDVLPEEHRQKALQLAKQIDPENHEAITAYGTEAQSKLLNFSHAMLDHVQKKDLGPIGDILKDLMKKLEQTNPDELQRER